MDTRAPLTSGDATGNDPRWRAVLARDKRADGRFWYSVATTGVYCRPSCPSRTANPCNVSLHATLAEARATGFRPCRRCDPEGPGQGAEHAELIARACRLVDASDRAPSLASLAQAANLSPGYFHRLFKAATGLTPKGYAAARRAARVRDQLAAGAPVTQALYDAGFDSSGGFYAKAADILGMAPSRYRDGGARETIRFAVGQSSLGAILVASSVRGVAAILLGEPAEALVQNLQSRFPKAELIGADGAYEQVVAQVVGLVEAPSLGLALPLDVRGTAFQQRVWRALQAIPPGETATYTEIARRIGAPTATRAVAGACAANALAVAIPCHRVIRHDGGLSGYRWGVERKRALIERERLPERRTSGGA